MRNNITQTAANKAAEEGGLPALPKESEWDVDAGGFNTSAFGYTANDMKEYARRAIDSYCNSSAIEPIAYVNSDELENMLDDRTATIQSVRSGWRGTPLFAADRASRQVANKAEVEVNEFAMAIYDISLMLGLPRGATPADVCLAVDRLATPPATIGASTAPRPTDDELWDATLRDRDAYHEWADKLADAIAAHFGVDIGEHSNQNLPWAEALEVIESAESVGASTVLTDERKPLGYARFRAAQRITTDGDVDANEWYEFCEPHDIGDDKLPAFPVYDEPVCEVAAQAGHDDDADVTDLEVRDALGDQYDPEVGEAVSVLRVMAAWKAEDELGEKYKQMALGAAQAGQVAVPAGWTIKQDGDGVHIEDSNGRWCVYERDTPAHRLTCEFFEDLIAADPSPAKESK